MDPQPGTSRSDTLLNFFRPPGPNWMVQVNDNTFDIKYLFDQDVWFRRTKKLIKKFIVGDSDTIHAGISEIVLDANRHPLSYYPFVMDHMTENYNYIIALAKLGQDGAIHVILDKIFQDRTLNRYYVGHFYEVFFINYLIRCYSWTSIYLMVRAQVAWPMPFKRLIKALFQNNQVPRIVLQDFVNHTSQHNQFMEWIMEIDFMTEDFIHQMSTINLVYLHSDKTPEMSEFVFKYLEMNYYYCYVNKQYGRLLLSVLNHGGEADLDHNSIKKILCKHGSIFKPACTAAFERMVANNVIQNQEEERYINMDNVRVNADDFTRDIM